MLNKEPEGLLQNLCSVLAALARATRILGHTFISKGREGEGGVRWQVTFTAFTFVMLS